MLKLNAAYAKKVPAEGEYTSQSYHASIEVELPDGLNTEQLHSKIHETFALVRESVEAELHGNGAASSAPAVEPAPAAARPAPTAPQNVNGAAFAGRGKAAGSVDTPASPKQIKFLMDLARNRGVTPDQIKARFGVQALEALTRTQCSRAIDEFSGKVA